MKKPKHLPLGTRVKFSSVLVKMKNNDRVMWPNFIFEDGPCDGVIIGVRTLKEGKTDYDPDCGSMFNAENHIQAYMVGTTLYRKPSFVPIDSVQEIIS